MSNRPSAAAPQDRVWWLAAVALILVSPIAGFWTGGVMPDIDPRYGGSEKFHLRRANFAYPERYI